MERFPTTDMFERFFSVIESTEEEIKAACNLCATHSMHTPGITFVTGESTKKTIFRDHVKVFDRWSV